MIDTHVYVFVVYVVNKKIILLDTSKMLGYCIFNKNIKFGVVYSFMLIYIVGHAN
jgi:hypothetical protein